MTARMLIVDDDAAIRDVVRYTFEQEGFAVDTAEDGSTAVEVVGDGNFDVVILDLMLPAMSGIDICRKLRERGNTTPIIMLTAKDAELDLVVGLAVGADDYVAKPFSRAELVSRVRAILRRREYDEAGAEGPVFVIGGVRVDMVRRSVDVDGDRVHLTPAEFKLLALLAEHRNAVVSRRELMEHLWDSDWVGDTRACDVHIWSIRRKIERDPSNPRRLVTVRGVGFTLTDEHEEPAPAAG